MLAIVWALNILRSYLYGAGYIKIYTDHQPLTFALGNRNFNAKLKRWKSRIEEFNCTMVYKPGKSNLVADALSRIPTQVYHLVSDTATVHSAFQDASQLIPHVENPINVYRNQLVFDANVTEYSCIQPPVGYARHTIPINIQTRMQLGTLLRLYLKPVIIIVVKIPDDLLQDCQTCCSSNFSGYKIRIT